MGQDAEPSHVIGKEGSAGLASLAFPLPSFFTTAMSAMRRREPCSGREALLACHKGLLTLSLPLLGKYHGKADAESALKGRARSARKGDKY